MTDKGWRVVTQAGAITVLLTVAVALAEIAINFLPGAPVVTPKTTVVAWFALFQEHWFYGLRQFGLLNLIGAMLLAPTYLALWSALGRSKLVTLGLLLFAVGAAIYLVTNRGFAMLSLSDQYMGATTDAQRSQLIAAGQVLVAAGKDRLGIILIDLAGLTVSAAMLRCVTFGKVTAVAGLLGSALLIVFEGLVAYAPNAFDASLKVAIAGGLCTLAWYVLVGTKLLGLARGPAILPA